MIDADILHDYISEARELLDEMEASLIGMEREGSSPELLNSVFRCVHCIKGSAEYVGLERSGTLAHTVESLLDRLREGVLPVRPPVVELLFRVKDVMSLLVEELAVGREEKTAIDTLMVDLSKMLIEPEQEVAGEPLSSIPERGLPTTDERPGPAEEWPDTGDRSLEDITGAERVPTVEVDFPGGEQIDSLLEAEGLQELDSDAEQPTAESTVEAPTPTPTEEIQTGVTLEETIPHVMHLGLYLDDLEDGLSLSNVRTAMLDTIRGLKKSAKIMGLPAAIRPLEDLESRILSIERIETRLPLDRVKELRSYLRTLHSFYPPDTFPSEEPTLPEPEITPTEEASPLPAVFFAELERAAGVGPGMSMALFEAGFISMEQLAESDESVLRAIPGMTPSIAAAILRAARKRPAPKREVPARKPGVSLLADVDEQLLREFEEVFEDDTVVPGPEHAAATPLPGSTQRPGFLLEQLDLIAQEADREILEIFLSFGWEITEKVRPITEKVQRGTISREDLESCAESLRAMRSSSSYMDYQKLAAFLEDWYEKTLWASEMLESLEPDELDFLEEKVAEFQEFLRGVEQALQPPAAAAEERPGPRAATPRTHPMPHGPDAARVTAPATKVSPPAELERKVAAAPQPPTLPPTQAPSQQAPAARPPEKARPGAPDEAKPAATIPETGVGTEAARSGRMAESSPATEDIAGRDVTSEGPVVRTMRVEAAKVDLLLNQVGELVVNRSYVEQLSLELKAFQRGLAGTKEIGKREVQALRNLSLKVAEASISLGRAATDLQEGVMKLRMLPVGQLFNRMPRLVRDLCRRMGKTVDLQIQGGDTEVDKRVIEQVYNPLVHLIRNAVDHGVEERETRLLKEKSEEGTIILNAYSQGNQVVIDVEDDGAGIDTDAIATKAVGMGLVDAKDVKGLSNQELYNFIFVPGFSTSTKVTRTSGRGVGMDVVKKDIERINGTVEIESWKGEGTRISIKIPLTLAIIQTLLIRALGQMYAIPLASVREIIQITPSEVLTIEGFQVVKFRDETIPILRLDEVFEMRTKRAAREPRFLVLSTTGLKTIGFYVEELIGEQDVVIKPLAEHVWKTRGLAGSSILGDGTIALVLDVAELVDDIIARNRMLGMTGGPASSVLA